MSVWTEAKYVCLSVDEVLQRVRATIESIDESDTASVDNAIKAHKNAEPNTGP